MSEYDVVRRLLIDRACPEDVVEGGLPGLVDRYEAIVRSVEEGYAFGLDDYLNDMDLRDLVAAGEVEITQRGRVVDPSTAKGPIRIRRRRIGCARVPVADRGRLGEEQPHLPFEERRLAGPAAPPATLIGEPVAGRPRGVEDPFPVTDLEPLLRPGDHHVTELESRDEIPRVLHQLEGVVGRFTGREPEAGRKKKRLPEPAPHAQLFSGILRR